ncbi:MAG TPA: FtsX-like permease family protein [Candidatus Limnocylindria bacterium]|nr:FtsX-like permease family protein [Candidatus Limnocylindria bacterium]
MIRPLDSLRLAYTKLRARRIRLAVTVIISGLLFTALITGSLVVRGFIAGFESFSQEGFGSRYIVTAAPAASGNPEQASRDSEVIERAKKLHTDLIARKKAAAKRLGVAYDEKAEPPVLQDRDMSGSDEQMVSFESQAGNQAIEEYNKKHPLPGLPQLKQIGQRYGATGYYSQNAPQMFPAPALQVLKNGKEEYKQESSASFGFNGSTGIDSFSGSWMSMDMSLLGTFLLPGQKAETGPDGAIPVFVPYTAAQELLALPKLSGTATPAEKLERLQAVRGKLSGLEYSVCYRNSTSADAVQQAIQQQAELARNKGKKDYSVPSLIYTTPRKPCTAPRLQKDSRPAAEKELAAKELQFRQLFGEEPAESQIVKFRVVGMVPDPPGGSAATFVQIVESIITSSVIPGWYSPQAAIDQNAVTKKLFDSTGNTSFSFTGLSQRFVEFPTADAARRFIREQNCEPQFTSRSGDPGQICQEAGRPFFVYPFGTSVALDDAKDFLGKYFRVAVLAVAGVSSIIMMGTVGRIIADSRRETAVFRAIGAKRLDIASIYMLYVLILALIIVLFAFVLGSAAALYLHNRYASDLTVSAIVSFNASDLTRQMTLYKVYLMDMFYVVGLIIMAALISSVLPLVTNLRRNPINDMRDER